MSKPGVASPNHEIRGEHMGLPQMHGPQIVGWFPLVSPYQTKGVRHVSHNQNSVVKWSTQPCKELSRRISAAISGLDCSLLTFIYPGFDYDSIEKS